MAKSKRTKGQTTQWPKEEEQTAQWLVLLLAIVLFVLLLLVIVLFVLLLLVIVLFVLLRLADSGCHFGIFRLFLMHTISHNFNEHKEYQY
jgi:Flp pilus assembly protein TadB